MTAHVLWLDDDAAPGNRVLGGKFGSLAEMTAAGFAVPLGFGITTDAYRAFLDASGLAEEARALQARAAQAELEEVSALSAAFTAKLEAAPLPAALEATIRDSYAELERRSGVAGLPVAVRSSGEAEDLAGASFAGQYDTFLWIRGADDVLRYVRRCWAGMFGTAVLTYRPDPGSPPPADLGICVGIQQMVDARTAGVMFTLDPVTGDRSKIVLEGVWGLGEGVVSGDLTPSRYVVDKVTFEILKRDITPQDRQHRFDETTAEVGLVPVPAERRELSPLEDEHIIRLAELAKTIERYRGAPQDIEWAVAEKGDVHVLQVRPETVWSRRAAEAPIAPAKSALDHVLARFAGTSITAGTGK
ncbi:PEP/pyruvate-binding domain-containing protein [Pseudonocardia sp.]|jgi:pyruvate,water dikinase|uniref:PEP/pyruvate-binding domain-containing protein n=1 Tax=Pseudonocardia sp. TaxID=60912 RepID=UPI002624C27D|nr:PEP/pyruvate-binding domain-containing protein [Pseudonocardia sp.]MCW2716664.1 pyruvate phosphate dikinase [Pseudonocardia sp.]